MKKIYLLKFLALALILSSALLLAGCRKNSTKKQVSQDNQDNSIDNNQTGNQTDNTKDEDPITEVPVLSITEQIPFYKKQLTMNYSKGVTIKPEYLVIHETANTNVGADANAHYRYWSTNPSANASTHFVVDSKQIYQMLELNQMAWHVGDNRGYSDITNYNSIGIEIAVNADGDYELARQNAIKLTIEIMNKLNMDISQLKTHNDASGKNCPTIMLKNRYLLEDFYAQVKKGLNKQF